jgi:L-ascorbate metabolism protein UlaG (beta-lactamase superfamily)
MKKNILIITLLLMVTLVGKTFAQNSDAPKTSKYHGVLIGNSPAQKTDTYKTSKGDLVIHFLGHGSLMFDFNKMNIYIDPFSKVADYSTLPKANLILVTHGHPDHFDMDAIGKIKGDKTQMVYTQDCANTGKYAGSTIVMKNGDKQTYEGIAIEAVPAYNIERKRPDGNPFHPKGEGNGYILTFGDKKVYIAGDTENIPEMKSLGKIDIAFLPMNLPYTMTPEQAADAAKMVRPTVFYPYHFGETDVTKLLDLMKDAKGIEVKVREMK